MRQSIVLGVALLLGGCAASYGERAGGFLSPQLAGAYIPLEGVTLVVLKAHAAAFVIAPGVAVTLFWSGGVTWALLRLVGVFVPLRVSRQHEIEGLDITQHGEALQ